MAARVLTNFRFKSPLFVRNRIQVPSSIWHKREFSNLSQNNGDPQSAPSSKASQFTRYTSKIFLGSVAIGAAAIAVYATGNLDHFTAKEPQSSSSSSGIDVNNKIQPLNDSAVLHNSPHEGALQSLSTGQVSESSSSNMDPSSDSSQDHLHLAPLDKETENEYVAESGVLDLTSKDELPKYSRGGLLPEDQNEDSKSAPVENDASNKLKEESSFEHSAIAEDGPKYSQPHSIYQEEMETSMNSHIISATGPEDGLGRAGEPQNSLVDAYHLRDGAEYLGAATTYGNNPPKFTHSSLQEDGKLMVDFLQAIHVAEQRQAEFDSRIFAEEKRKLKEKYEKELKDARARELMYAEEAAMLDKEMKKERAKAAAALKSLKEKAEESLKIELQQKEAEANSKIREVEELGKAEVAAAIAREKAAQIEKMVEANLNINALCMAFYARSEEARQSHSVQKLALGALALEDTLSKGLPMQPDVDTLRMYLEGLDKGSLLDLALSSLPEDTRCHGTMGVPQLNKKFEALKGMLRHFSLMPPRGGGILAHSLAHVASFLKVKEAGDGIESVLHDVDCLLAEGKLAEAADALENGVKGSEAAEVVVDWVREARNRAIVDQALALLESYATCVSLT